MFEQQNSNQLVLVTGAILACGDSVPLIRLQVAVTSAEAAYDMFSQFRLSGGQLQLIGQYDQPVVSSA
jgi:hypothetical protein